MAASPFRRSNAAKTARNLAFAEAAIALAKDRATAAAGRRSRRPSGRLLLIGGAVAAAGAVALLKRDKVAGLLPSRAGGEPAPGAPFTPQPSNYDVRGPVANTATPIPVPEPASEPPAPVDEAAEEAAAAAEAAAIGGAEPTYAGRELGEQADPAERPLAEAGEGADEGAEQAEAELIENATYRDAGMTDADRQIDDAIEQAGQPLAGETPEPLASEPAAPPAPPDPAQESFLPPTADPEETPGGGISGRPFAGLDEPPVAAPEDAAPPAPEPKPEEPKEDSDDWRTWSGRSVNP